AFLRSTNALVCTRAHEGAGEIYRNPRGAGGHLRRRSGKNEGEVSPRRASRGAFGKLVLLFTIRGSSSAFRGWIGRLCQFDVGSRIRTANERARSDCISPFAGSLLQRNHTISRISEIR